MSKIEVKPEDPLLGYIEYLEEKLENEGYKKICSYCTLVCFPIWGKDDSWANCCEICDEGCDEMLVPEV